MSTALKMLDMASVHSARMYEQMDQAMTKGLNIQANASNAEVNLAMKGLQFAEQQRMNDAQIVDMNINNSMRAKEFDMKMQLAPLQRESALLRLEADKINFQRANKAQKADAFNNITKEYDDFMGLHFLETQNPDHMKSYLDYKAQWMDRITQGGEFDTDSYRKGLRKINDGFADVVIDKKDYNPSTSHMLGRVSTVAQQRYEQQNPAFAKNKNALAASLVGANRKDFTSGLQQVGNMLSPEEVGFLAVSNNIIENNRSAIEYHRGQAEKYGNAIRLSENDTEKARYQEALDTHIQSVTDAVKQNNDLTLRVTMGQYTMTQQAPPTDTVDDRPDPTKWDAKNDTVMGIKKIDDSETSAFKQRLRDIEVILNKENPQESEVSGLDFRWFAEDLRKDNPDTKTLLGVKGRIEQRVEALDNLASAFNKENIDQIIGTINRDTDIPINDTIAEIIKKNYNLFGITDPSHAVGTRIRFNKMDKNFITKHFTGGGIQSYEDLNKIVRAIPNKAERKAVKQELYVTLLAAATSNAIKEP